MVLLPQYSSSYWYIYEKMVTKIIINKLLGLQISNSVVISVESSEHRRVVIVCEPRCLQVP